MPKVERRCQRCNSEALTAEFRLATDSDPTSDEDRVWLRCEQCDARYLAQVTESVRGGSEHGGAAVTNEGRSCEPQEWDRTLALARRCPSPRDARCACPAHQTMPVVGAAAWYVS